MSLKPFFSLCEFSMFFSDHLNTLGVTGLYVNVYGFHKWVHHVGMCDLVYYVQKCIFRCSTQDPQLNFRTTLKTLEINYSPAQLLTLENPTVDM